MTATTATARTGPSGAPAAADGAPAAGRELARVVLPHGADADVLPLYVDGELVQLAGVPAPTGHAPRPEDAATTAGGTQNADQVLGRRRYLVPAGTRSSFGTYFNAFPAGYWRRWTVVASVVLRVRTSGAGTVVVYRSNAKGNIQRVDAVAVDDAPAAGGQARTRAEVELPLKPFTDGGWYWFDLVAGQRDLVLEEASWSAGELTEPIGDQDGAPSAARRQGRATVAITTFDRPDYCGRLLATLGADEGLAEAVAEVVVVDQGTRKVRDDPAFPAAQAALGPRLRVVDQGNLGGSGGFARGMAETLRSGSDYVLLLDDDVEVETEGILRGVAFADLARTTTIVGGHMFSLYSRGLLHAAGESVQRWRFWWGPNGGSKHDHDLSMQNLRSTPWLHRRFDVDYNGWWMCLVPRQALERLGLSLPVFIKWDDAEYGLRAGDAGIPTVSLPGMAVWHVPWTDKDDSVDWQAYFHARNRIVAALLHSPYPRGGNVVRESFATQVKHLLSMQYSTAELRLLALEDVFRGWDGLHADLPTKLAQVRALRARYGDAVARPDAASYPRPRRRKPPRRGREVEVPRGRLGTLLQVATGTLKQVRPVDDLAKAHPQAAVPHMDAKWWLLSQFDSALVSTADGTGLAWYQRDPQEFGDVLRRSLAVHRRLLAEWPRLARAYRDAAVEGSSPQRWERTFAAAAPPR